MSTALGVLENVKAREFWPHEEYDFTPWLAQDENIAKLGEELGIELQVEGVEVSVGPFTADILAKTSSDAYVIIENQFGKTNHDHLGKVLTYGATWEANTVVWLAERFTPEHRRAIEWLNERSTDGLALYAVELELWKIDNSRPAVRFNVISKPLQILKDASAAKADGAMTEAKKLQLEFWTAVRERILEKKIVASAQAARSQYWYNVPLGKSNIRLSAIANTADNKIGLRVYISHKAAPMLAALEAQKTEIEAELGTALQWNPNPDNDDKVIVLARDADLGNRDNWPEYVDWMSDRIKEFRTTFGSRIKSLELP